MSERRVVVTGLGATTPLGGTIAETWDGILAGRSGAKPLDQEMLDRYELPVHFACTIAQDPLEVLTKVQVRRMDPSAQYAVIASLAAMEDAGSPEIDPLRLGVAIGTGIGGVWTLLDQWDNLREKGVRRVFPLSVPMLMPNTSAGNVSLLLGARAGAHTTVSACASGAESMGTGYDMIRGGRADMVVAGGTECATHPICFAGFSQMQALSTRNDDPAAASRPYDTGRDGFVMGEGAAVMVLEEYEHAKARGARIYAEFASIGMSADAHHITAPEPEGAGASRAMLEAVSTAGGTLRDVVHINAHATSTPVGDVAETNAIRRAFGDLADSIPVSATKSMTGHLLGGAGGVESVFSVLAVHHQISPPTINIFEQDPECDLDYCANVAREMKIDVAMKNNFGFGGTNGTLVFRRV